MGAIKGQILQLTQMFFVFTSAFIFKTIGFR